MKALLIIAPFCAFATSCAEPQDKLNQFFVAEQIPTLKCFAALQAKSEHFTQQYENGGEPSTAEISTIMDYATEVCDDAADQVGALSVPELDDKVVGAKIYRGFQLCKIGQSALSRHIRRMADLQMNGPGAEAGMESDQITKDFDAAVKSLSACSKAMVSALNNSEYTFPASDIYAASERLMVEARQDVADLADPFN